MSFDLFQSRATYNEPCRWWSRKEDGTESDEIVMKRIPSGTFMAKEVSPESLQNTVVSGAFMFDKSTITIKSSDNLHGIKNNDLVIFRDEKWFVESVQKTKARTQNTLFGTSESSSHFWYLELRK